MTLAPLQVSDDSELALCLALGLTEGRPPLYPAEAVARRYGQWYKTRPFDIGQATTAATSAAARAADTGLPCAEAMWEAAAQVNFIHSICYNKFARRCPIKNILFTDNSNVAPHWTFHC